MLPLRRVYRLAGLGRAARSRCRRRAVGRVRRVHLRCDPARLRLCLLTLRTKTVVPSSYRLTTLDENLAAEAPGEDPGEDNNDDNSNNNNNRAGRNVLLPRNGLLPRRLLLLCRPWFTTRLRAVASPRFASSQRVRPARLPGLEDASHQIGRPDPKRRGPG